VTGQHRTTQRHHPAATTPADPDAGLRQWLRDYAAAHPRWGHRRAYHDARGEGWTVNHKKLQRLWRDEGLRVPQRHRRKRLGTSTADRVTADAPNRVWAVDFQFDSTTDGRPVKIVSIVDEHTRACLGGLVDRSITSDRLIDELDRLAQDRGYPAVLHCDNGPELTCAEMADSTECASLIWPNLEASAGLVWPHPLDQSFPFTFGSAARAIAKRPGREGDPARCASQAPKCVRRRLKSGGSAGAVLGVLGSRMLRPTRRVRLAGRVPRRAELLPSGVAGMRDPLQSRQA
jgi:hypothetical protein